MRSLPQHNFPSLDPLDMDFLGKSVTYKKIKKALFEMTLLKASGSDCFSAIFFQQQWDIVGPIVCDWVKKVFNGGNIDAELNNTLIVLIPRLRVLRTFLYFNLSAFALSSTNWWWRWLLIASSSSPRKLLHKSRLGSLRVKISLIISSLPKKSSTPWRVVSLESGWPSRLI